MFKYMERLLTVWLEDMNQQNSIPMNFSLITDSLKTYKNDYVAIVHLLILRLN
jgi:hypothetical protein